MATVERRRRTAAADMGGGQPHIEVRAEARWVRVAPRKAQLVVGEIRGQSVAEARTILAFMSRAAARDVEKVLKSAVANAETNHGLSADELFITSAYVGVGPTLKRWRARARGRVGRVRKRTCHITILIAPVESGVAAPAPVVEEKPRRTRRAQAQPGPAPTSADEKPKRKRTAKKPAAAEMQTVPDEGETSPDQEPPVEVTPAKARAAAAEAEAAPAAIEAPATEVEGAATAVPAAKPRRTRAKKVEPASTDDGTASEEKPKPTRRRKTPDEETGKES